jgi:hypothetical protein
MPFDILIFFNMQVIVHIDISQYETETGNECT